MTTEKMFDKKGASRLTAIVLATGLMFAAAAPAQAQQGEWTKEKSGIVAGSSVAGAVLGGPVGFVLGMAAGDWLGNSVNKANESGVLTAELSSERDQALAELARVQEQLLIARQEAGRYQDLALDSLQLNVMFSTAGDTLNMRDENRLNVLVRLLKEQPQLNIQLAGFADPRGADEYNLKLSERRAASVRGFLISKGIEAHRIQKFAYGARQSDAPTNNLDAYAMERVVTVKLQENSEELVASE
ncbi:OmpA family protein [Parendozoicomonas sp. Alg238-R29]|uniref:OmpA family protein n=1 Tax=Parendozoicomonas sp. Alg238-R29 TaxID=2993446 RepID=UPI00248E60B5|nr:OmpA family protein [Parendozoicomonas sp. Alg238-R29]